MPLQQNNDEKKHVIHPHHCLVLTFELQACAGLQWVVGSGPAACGVALVVSVLFACTCLPQRSLAVQHIQSTSIWVHTFYACLEHSNCTYLVRVAS